MVRVDGMVDDLVEDGLNFWGGVFLEWKGWFGVV